MGLTINYRFAYRGTGAELRKRLDGLAERFREMPVQSVDGVIEIERALVGTGCGHYQDERHDQAALGLMMTLVWFGQSAAEKAMDAMLARIGGTVHLAECPPQEQERYHAWCRQAEEGHKKLVERIAKSANGFCLKVNVDGGCDWFRVMLGRFGKSRLWHGAWFTKTQYAEHFVEAHLAVIKLLDLCKEAGILENVKDEGGYWESRDLEVLAKNINISTETIRSVAGALGDAARKRGLRVDAAIERSANYVHVKKPRRFNREGRS